MRKWSGAGAELATLFEAGAIGGQSDAELLARFVRREDDASSEAAFAALVSRHGPMVLGVCRRMLGDDHAAADAFQAVFLVLARKAPHVRVDDSLGRWLHGVSVRVARRARAVARAERVRVRALDGIDPPDVSTSHDPEGRHELRSAIDEEIARLPGRYRSAVVLCFLEGLTQEQAARRLRCPVRTVESRLRRARERLRPSLARRGLAPADWSSATLAAAAARADPSPALAAMACRVAGAPAGTVPAAVAGLSRSTMRSLSMSRTVSVASILVAIGAAAMGAAILAGGVGGRGTEPATPRDRAARVDPAAARTDPAQARQPGADGRLDIRAVVAATGKPIENATVTWQLRVNNGKYSETKNSTDRDGRAVLEWPRGATVNGLNVTVQKAGFVPYLIRWDDTGHPLQLPPSKILQLVPGIPIGGVVKDEAGAPIAGANVTVHAPPTEAEEKSHYSTDIAETTTDAAGRWRFDDAPSDLIRVNTAIRAPRFLRSNGPASRNLDAVTVLNHGFTIKGRVLDTQGRPVVGATVSGGDHWNSEPKPTRTDGRGEFVLEGCPPGASVVTVQAKGFAPDLREVHPEDQPALDFRLAPGQMIRGKVVDRQGRPIAGVSIAADTWRNHRSLDFRVDTDKEGRFEWRGAPGDTVLCDFFKIGYMSRRRVAMTSTDTEPVVTVDPMLVITGKVTDAETGRPLPTFRAVRGLVFANNPRVAWREQDAAEFTGGHYWVRHDEPYAGYAVRIEVPGYKPAESPVFRPGEATATYDFALTRAAAGDLLTGIVFCRDGRPAAGAEVALATPEHPLIFENGQFRLGHGNGMSFANTGADGRFSFDKPGRACLLAATSDDGYAEAAPTDLAKSVALTLKPWGKVKGRARIGRQPAANEVISFGRRGYQPPGPGGVHAFYGVETRTDAQGNFTFDRVIPGAGEVARVVITELGNGSRWHMGCWQEPVDVAPGQTVLIHIGARGRPVIGRVALQAAPGVRVVDWRQNRPATIERPRSLNPLRGLLGLAPHQNDRFAAGLDKDGRFRIDDVPPGHYQLTVTIDAPPVRDRPGPAEELGRVTVLVDVPAGDDDVPVDLGEIRAEIKGR